jgi:hypothetical protein
VGADEVPLLVSESNPAHVSKLIHPASVLELPLIFPIPNMTGLFLHQAHLAWTESQALLQEAVFMAPPSKSLRVGQRVTRDEAALFGIMEQRMVAIVFAYTALESFANESIPDDYTFSQQRNDKRFTEVYTKAQAEFLNLDIKLGNVLPPIFGVNTPKGGKIWNNYRLIKDLRDRIIHMKSKDRMPNTDPAEDTIWRELLDKSKPNVALVAKDIVGYYLTKIPDSEKPRWFTLFPH